MRMKVFFCLMFVLALAAPAIAAAPHGETQPLRQMKYDGKHPVTVKVGELAVTVDNKQIPGTQDRLPVARITYQGKAVLELAMSAAAENGQEEPAAEVRLMKLAPAGAAPEVVFTYFWGGAHCCTVTEFGTMDAEGNWHAVDGGALDGDVGYEFRDLDGDGGSELVSVDNSFLYAFACYACSYAPTRIKKLAGAELQDVTMQPRYRSFLRQRLKAMETSARADRSVLRTNGYLAGWVAAKALVGELPEAWRRMLADYERNSDWPLEECTTDPTTDQCPEGEKRQLTFPEALAKHLLAHDYITADQAHQLDLGSGRRL